MTTPYGYIQIVLDDDWGLVGIVPPNHDTIYDTYNPQSTQQRMMDSSNLSREGPNYGTQSSDVSKAIHRETGTDSQVLNLQSNQLSFMKENNSTKAIIVPSTTSITHEKLHDTTAESKPEYIHIRRSTRSNPNSLTGLDFSKPLSDSSEYRSINSSYNVSETVGFGNISSLATIHNNSIALVGFGK